MKSEKIDIIKVVEEKIKRNEKITTDEWEAYIRAVEKMDEVEIFTSDMLNKAQKEMKKLNENEYITGELLNVDVVRTKFGERLRLEFKDFVMFLPIRYKALFEKVLGKAIIVFRREDRVIKGRKGKYLMSRYDIKVL